MINYFISLDDSLDMIDDRLGSTQRHTLHMQFKLSFMKFLGTLDGDSISIFDDTEDDDDNRNQLKVSGEDSALFVTVYHAAMSETPSSQINGLLDLQKRNGVSMKYENLSWPTITEIQETICRTLVEEVVAEVRNVRAFGLALDESTDITLTSLNFQLSIQQ